MQDVELVDALGLCEHCNALLSIVEFSHDKSMNGEWHCVCNGKITHLSFGYDQGGKGAKRVKWVGPSGKWVTKRPKRDFELNGVFVLIKSC